MGPAFKTDLKSNCSHPYYQLPDHGNHHLCPGSLYKLPTDPCFLPYRTPILTRGLVSTQQQDES